MEQLQNTTNANERNFYQDNRSKGNELKNSDLDQFTAILTATMEIHGHRTSAEAITIWCAALAEYELPDVRAALSAHIKTAGVGRFAPKPADIIGILEEMDGRPGVEASWARLSHAIGDERATLVLTNEERSAFFVADAIADDKIAARMAFKETYAKAVHEARLKNIPVRWSAILGGDPSQRETALLAAVESGQLPTEYIATLLPDREQPLGTMKLLLDSRWHKPGQRV
jgi:hypothetical protein